MKYALKYNCKSRYDISMKLTDLNHHAYYIVGDDSVCESLAMILNKKHKIQIKGNPDFSIQKYENFTVDDARLLKANAEMRPVGGGENLKKIFIIQMNGITVEAQNALLKLLEEPAEYVHFFLIVPSAHLLLPTVRSRMSVIQTCATDTTGGKSVSSNNDDNPIIADTKSFISMSIPKRLDFIKKLMDDITKEKKTKQDVIELLNAIELQIYKDGGTKKTALALSTIEKARTYMHDRAPSFKMLLEYVALNI